LPPTQQGETNSVFAATSLLETAAQIRASFLIEVREEKLNSFGWKKIADG